MKQPPLGKNTSMITVAINYIIRFFILYCQRLFLPVFYQSFTTSLYILYIVSISRLARREYSVYEVSDEKTHAEIRRQRSLRLIYPHGRASRPRMGRAGPDGRRQPERRAAARPER